VLAALALGVPDELDRRLAELASPRADVRAGAEHWLAAHLERAHYAPLAEAARAGDAEVRGRIRAILSADERHLALALALCAEREEELERLGREAVRASIARADPALAEPGVRAPRLASALSQLASDSPPRAFRVDPSLPLDVLADHFELTGELPIGLAVDGPVATRTARRSDAPLAGPWDDLLLRIAAGLGLSLEGHGLASARIGAPKSAFLVFTARAEARTGVDWVEEWLEEVAAGTDPARGARAARNLAASGFAPALTLLDGLARGTTGAVAREGLIRAAARGRVAPALLAPGVLEELLARAEQADGAPTLRALARIGCTDAEGRALSTRLMAGFATATPGGRWVRLSVLGANRCSDPAAEEAAAALLAAPGTPPELRLGALLTLAALGSARPPDPRWNEGLSALAALPLDEPELERLGRALALLGLAPPFPRPEELPAAWGDAERLRLLDLWSWNAESGIVAAHVAAWFSAPGDAAARGELLADRLAAWIVRGRTTLVAAALEGARASAPGRAREIDRVRLLLGLVPAARVPELFAGGADRGDLAVLGRLAGYPEAHAGERAARSELVRLFEAALAEERASASGPAVVRAAERAVRGLFAAGRDQEGAELSLDLRRALRARPRSELARRLDAALWPPGPAAPPRDLARELARGAAPSGP
jgi:hypothetical protein